MLIGKAKAARNIEPLFITPIKGITAGSYAMPTQKAIAVYIN